MDRIEKMLSEAINGLLNDRAELGLAFHNGVEETSHFTQFHWNNLEDAFRIKINNPNIKHYESLSGAFFQTHSYRNIDDPRFELSFRKQMSGMAVPPQEQELAIKYVEELRNDFDMPVRDTGRRKDNWSASAEESTGYSDMESLRNVTQPTNDETK
jgi:hypothetical protein